MTATTRKLRFILSPWVIIPLLAAAMLGLYLRSFSGWAVADDLQHLKGAVAETHPFRIFFRPLEHAVNLLNVRWLSLENLMFARATGLAGFLTVVLSTYTLGRRLGAALPAAFAAALVAVSPLATTSVVQIDTLSQQFVTVFALLFLLSLLAAKSRSSWPLYGLAYAFALLALLSKETAPGLVAAVPLAVFLLHPKEGAGSGRTLRGLLGDYVMVIVIAALYAALRLYAGIDFGSSIEAGQYELEVTPARIARNLALYGGNLFYTGGSTLDLFPTLVPWRVAVSGLFTGTLLVISGIGTAYLVREHRFGKPLLSLCILTFAGVFPVVLTERISELYTYGSLPFYALLLGFAFPAGAYTLASRFRARWLRPAAVSFAVLLLAWSAWGAAEKVRLVADLGTQSLGYFEQTRAFLKTDAEGPLRLCWQDRPEASTPTYSILVMNPNYVATRAIDFAAWVEERTLYLAAPDQPFKGLGVVAGSWLPSPLPFGRLPPKTLVRTAGACTYQVRLENGTLRFTQN